MQQSRGSSRAAVRDAFVTAVQSAHDWVQDVEANVSDWQTASRRPCAYVNTGETLRFEPTSFGRRYTMRVYVYFLCNSHDGEATDDILESVIDAIDGSREIAAVTCKTELKRTDVVAEEDGDDRGRLVTGLLYEATFERRKTVPRRA